MSLVHTLPAEGTIWEDERGELHAVAGAARLNPDGTWLVLYCRLGTRAVFALPSSRWAGAFREVDLRSDQSLLDLIARRAERPAAFGPSTRTGGKDLSGAACVDPLA